MKKIIYCLTFPNNKKYIGKTEKSLEERINAHKDATKYVKRHLYNAIKKYGWDSIRIEILKECETTEELNELEKKFISENNTTDPNFGYNLRSGGEGGLHSQETKDKIAKKNSGPSNGMYGKSSRRGIKASEETRKKLSESHKGQKAWNKGKKLKPTGSMSIDIKEKISKANSGENNGQAKLNWELVNLIREEYATGNYKQKELAEKFNISKSVISEIVNNNYWRKNEAGASG